MAVVNFPFYHGPIYGPYVFISKFIRDEESLRSSYLDCVEVYLGCSSMEFFEKARTVRLKGHHGKYLWAEDDEYKISQNRENKNEQALWRVEKVPGSKLIRLLSCFGTYLTCSDDPFLLGMTGKKVVQSKPKHIDSSVEWEPVSEGFLVKLKTCHGNFLRANAGAGLPPWRGSVTHDLPQRFPVHQEYLLWEVETVTIPNVIPAEVPEVQASLKPTISPHRESHHAWVPLSPKVSRPKPDEGREIYYVVANESGEVQNVHDAGWSSLKFKGHSLDLLRKRLKTETGIEEDIVLCARHPSSTKLFPLRLGLPPNNVAMHIVVVKASSPLTKTLSHGISD